MICIVLQLQAGRDLTREFSMKRCTSNIQFIVNNASKVCSLVIAVASYLILL